MKRLYHERHLRRIEDTGRTRSLALALVDLVTNTTKAERKELASKATTTKMVQTELKWRE